MSFYKICPHCGANLDPGEVCGCLGLETTIQEGRELFPERFKGLSDFEVVHEIARVVKTARGATNTTDGKAEKVLGGPNSASNITENGGFVK